MVRFRFGPIRWPDTSESAILKMQQLVSRPNLPPKLVHVLNLGGLSGSEDRGGGDNSIQFMNFWRVGDKNFK